MSSAVHAYGTQLALNGTTVSEVTNITPPGISADTIDVTNHGSEDGYREFVKGLKDGGEISIEGNYVIADAETFKNAVESTASQNAVIALPLSGTGSTWSASVLCTGFESDAPVDDKVSFSATFKVTGKPVFI